MAEQPSAAVGPADYATSDARSFYGYEVATVHEVMQFVETIDQQLNQTRLCGSYVHSAEIVLAVDGVPYATVWWDSENESWRAMLTRPDSSPQSEHSAPITGGDG